MSNRHRACAEAFTAGYRVNELGEVRSPFGLIRKLTTTRYGYKTFNMKFDGCSYPILVHQLVAYQKFGEAAFAAGVVVRHRNGIRSDNTADNVLIGSPSDNMMDIDPAKRHAKALKAARSQAKLTDDDVAFIRGASMTLRQIMAKYGISKSTASFVRSGKTYKTKITGS